MSSPADRNEPPDGLDGWLNTPVEPLPPRPGTYEAIVRRARRRRLHRAVTAAGTAAMVIAGAAFVPQLGGLLTAQGVHAPPVSPARHSPRAALPQVPPSTAPAPQVTGGPGRLVQPGFTPVSVTFIGLKTGWALGQYRAPCPGGGCTALARTDDTGQHWTPVSGPDAGAPDGGSGVSRVRFLDQDNGWVFGPELRATHDGGQTWNKVSTGGQRVTGLETTGDRVFAVFARCSGAGRGWNTGCSWHQLRSAPASGGPWTAVPGASGPGTARLVLTRTAGYLLAQDGEAVTLSTGPITGTGTGTGAWTAAPPVACGQQSGQPPATPGTAPTPAGPAGPAAGGNTGSTGGATAAGSGAAGSGAAGTPALVAAASASDLYLLCPPGTSAATGAAGTGATSAGATGTGTTGTGATGPGAAGPGAAGPGAAGTGGAGTAVYLSTDGGEHWQPRGSASAAAATSAAAAGSPPPGTAASPASGTASGTAPGGGSGGGSGGTLLIGTPSGVYVSGDGGMTWQMSLQLPGGVSYVGMTGTRQGFAVPARNGGDAIWFTEDGGQSWHPSAI